MEKRCTSCGEVKALELFITRRKNSTGRGARCKACDSKSACERADRDRERKRAVDRARYAANRERHRQQKVEYRQRLGERAHEERRAREATLKGQARKLLRDAVRVQKVLKPAECQSCGSSLFRIDGHHHDYTKPFDVEWLCTPCHGVRHRIGA